MFKEQGKAVGYIPRHQFGLLKLKLEQAGYEYHDGPRTSRDNEVATFRNAFDSASGLRQNHVQIVDRGSVFAIYAHTEPHTERWWAHTVSAIGDGASFSGGSRMLGNDLASGGYYLMSYADAIEASRRRG